MNREIDASLGDFAGPYSDLFVYHLRGRVKHDDERDFGENFIGNWVEDESSFLFFSVPSYDIITELLRKQPDFKMLEDYHFTYEQWQGHGLKSITIEDFLILPPWESQEVHDGTIKIILDPGVVFGTGLHPTTRDCLKAMLYLHRKGPWEKVLDLGTGTGVLALAAAFLGAKTVLAVDVNPLSVKTTQKNIHLNRLEETIRVVQAKAEGFVDDPADLILANLHYEVIARLLEMKGFRKKRWLIISGLMRSQSREVKSKLEKYDLRLMHEWDHEMTWYTMLLESAHP